MTGRIWHRAAILRPVFSVYRRASVHKASFSQVFLYKSPVCEENGTKNTDAVGSHVETSVLRRVLWARCRDCVGGDFESRSVLAAYVHWDEDFSVSESGLVKNPLCRQIADSNASGTLWRSCSVVKRRRGKTLHDTFWPHEILFPKCVANTAVFLLYLLS